MNKYQALRTYFGHSAFRGAQETLVDSILAHRDCLGVMPTGAGKSVCFQLPALVLSGTAVVISPLISLMQDQVSALRQNGIPAACINSSVDSAESFETFRRAASGELKILYVAPERLETESFARLCENMEIPLVAVDEAHCVSHWGQDFRPSYLKIAGFVNSISPRPVISAFTATATDVVKNDIVNILGLRDPIVITSGFDRPNLYFDVRKPESKDEELLDIFSDFGGGSAIVYCATRKNAVKVCETLCKNGIKAAVYHAGISAAQRKAAQEDFLCDRINVIVATNAFGMGIDKSNVSLVVHYNMPKDVESYYQEAGRAGRDGTPARCILLYGYGDAELARFMIDVSHDESGLPPAERKELKDRDITRLRKMVNYCETRRCLRSYILGYFGESAPESCGNCSNCGKPFEVADVTVEAQKILSCIFRLKQRRRALGKVLICRILVGSKDKRILGEGLDTLSTYGVMKGVPKKRVREIMDFLEAEGYFEVCGENSVCVLTPKADEFVRSKSTILMRSAKRTVHSAKEKRPAASGPNPGLFAKLRALRSELASELGVPPYVVFTDASLWDMCAKLPRDHDEFLEVSGVGFMKAERYGKIFLSVINDYIAAENLR